MRWAGAGTDLWHARVDLLAPDQDGARVSPAHSALLSELHGGDMDGFGGAGVDQGTGTEGQPVLGFSFWVRANDVAGAATMALLTARRAGASSGAGPGYYDITLVPREAVRVDWSQHDIRMPD